MIQRRKATRAALMLSAVVATAGLAVGTVSATTPATDAPVGSTPAAADPCAKEAPPETTPETTPPTTPATTAGTAAATTPATEPPATEPPATEVPATEAPRDTVAPIVTQLDATTAIDINEQPRDALQQGGELRQAVSSLADNWNPNHPLGNERDYSDIRGAMSYSVWNFKADGSSALDPNYVLESSTSDGTPGQPFTVTYKLNPKAIWNNGDPIDADDYIQNWKMLNGSNPDVSVVATEGYDAITDVKAGADKFEVVITFKDVYPDYKALFSGLVPMEAYADANTYENGWTDLVAIKDWFTGPFIIDSVDTVQGIVTEVPNPNWWGDKPLLDKMVFRVVDPAATPTAYANNELDTFDIGPDPNGFMIANTTPGGDVRAAAGPNWRHITFNTKAGLLQDKTIRQAIVRSLERGEIGVSDLAGIPWPAQPLNNHIFVENQAGYQDNAGDFAYDPERVKADLDAAGWVAGADGIREKDGQRLTVKFSRLVGVPVSENEAQLVQAQLKDVGIDVQIVDVATKDFSNVLDERDFELIAFTWIGTPFPYRFDQIFGNCSDSNYSSSYIDGFDDIVAKVAVTVDETARAALANEADKMLWDFVTTLPLYQRPELIAVNAKLANFGAFGFQTPAKYEDIGWMK